MSVVFNPNPHNVPSMLENITAYKPFMKMQSAGYANVMKWSDGNYTAELLEPIPSDVPGGDDYTGSTNRQTQVTNMNTTLSSYFSAVSSTIAASGTKKYVTPEWFRAHAIRQATLRSGAASMTIAGTTPTWFGLDNKKRGMVFLDADTIVAVGISSNALYGAVATRSGTTWTWAAQQLLNNSTTWSSEVNGLEIISSNKLVFMGNNNSLHPTAIVIDHSAGTLTAGTPNTWLAQAVSSALSFCTVASNKIMVHYKDPGTSNYTRAIAATVSGTTFTFGSAVTFETYTDGTLFFSTSHTTDAAVCIFTRASGTNYLCAFTVSGTTVTAGSTTNISTSSGLWMRALSTSRILIFSGHSGASTSFSFVCRDISGTTITNPSISFSLSSTNTWQPAGFVIDGTDFYVQSTVSSVDTVYKFSYTGSAFTQVYARRHSGGIPSLWGNLDTGGNVKNNVNTVVGGSVSGNLLYTYEEFLQIPELSFQVGTETAVTGQDIEFQATVTINSANYYRKSYLLVTRTDVGTGTVPYSLVELLYETK